MKNILFEYKGFCQVETKKIEALAKQLIAEIENVQDHIGNGYVRPYSSVNLPADNAMRMDVERIVQEKKALRPTCLIVCGIGGSSLGTQAVVEAVKGKFYNNENSVKTYFADTVDTTFIQSIYAVAKQELENGNEIILNVVTKSGTTTETIANFEIFFDLLKNLRPDTFHNFIVVTTDYDSPLYVFAQKNKLSILPIPQQVGGRYSVLSSVGQFPLAMIGIDVRELLQGAQDAVKDNTQTTVDSNTAALNAIIKYALYQQGIMINDLFVFSVQMEGVGKWYRQLLGESLGKEFDIDGNKINTGITPTVSVGSIDLHSVGQLYLGGPYDKFITFLSVQEYENSLQVPNLQEFNQLVASIQGKSLPFIMHAILQGVKAAYKNNKRPFCSITLPKLSEYFIGNLLQMYMLEIMYLGFLLKINPFDQPNVEQYKQETRKLL